MKGVHTTVHKEQNTHTHTHTHTHTKQSQTTKQTKNAQSIYPCVIVALRWEYAMTQAIVERS